MDSIRGVWHRQLSWRMVFQSLAAQRAVTEPGAKACARHQCGDDAGGDPRSLGAGILCFGVVQYRVLCTTILVGTDYDNTCRRLPAIGGWHSLRPGGFWRGHRGRYLRSHCRSASRTRIYLWRTFCRCWDISPNRLFCPRLSGRQDSNPSNPRPQGDSEPRMKITEVRTRVVQWEGRTVPLPAHFCTNPMDLVAFREASMGNFAFHGWVLVEIFTDCGHVGLGNAALSPIVTKTLIDTYLKPLLIGADPWDTEYLWQQMYRRTMAFGRKGVAITAISAVDIALWDLLGKSAQQPVFRLLGGRTKDKIPVYASRLYAMPIPELRAEAERYKAEGYKAMKLRFGWGPIDGAAGMQKNIELVRAVREVIGEGIDLMADAYMGWTLDYAKRMLPLLEPFHLRWLEEPVIPDDTRGYEELKSYGRIPIAGGEHEFTVFGFRELLESNALDYIQFDTNRVGGISQARKICGLAESFQVPVVPHAGQMHNYHVTMASLNAPIAEFFPKVDVEVGNELFWYIFDGEPFPKNDSIDLDESLPGLGLTVNEESLKRFTIIE